MMPAKYRSGLGNESLFCLAYIKLITSGSQTFLACPATLIVVHLDSRPGRARSSLRGFSFADFSYVAVASAFAATERVKERTVTSLPADFEPRNCRTWSRMLALISSAAGVGVARRISLYLRQPELFSFTICLHESA